MEEIKFRYAVKRENSYYFEKIFTLDKIEKGIVKKWIEINHINEKDLKREQFINFRDMEDNELYENDMVLVFINNELVGKAKIEYDSNVCVFVIIFEDGRRNIIGMNEKIKIRKIERDIGKF